MAKRFRDTNLGRDSWFRRLTPVYKCVWNFLCDECDAAGVWSIDEDTLEFHIGSQIDLEDFIAVVNNGKPRLEKFGKDKLLIVGFIEFQYGHLSDKCIPHQKIIALLIKHNLLDRYMHRVADRVETTLQEEEEEEDKEKDKEKERGSGGKQKVNRRPNIRPEVESNQTALKQDYQTLVTELENVPELKDQRIKVADFISTKRPEFIEPYMDMWNLSVRKYGLAQVEGISDGRVKKFKTRIKETMFDFIKILTEINQSSYLQGKDNEWKVDFDWIFENDTNYLKIIEGKYRNKKN